MYPIAVHARTPEEMFTLMHRLKLKELLDGQMTGKGLVDYAKHGLFLGVHRFAGELNFLVMTHLDEKVYEGLNLPARIFYCIHEAGGSGLGEMIKYDHEKVARQIVTEKADAMEEFKEDE